MKKRRAFITGIAGFAGSYLAEELLTEGFEVLGSLYGNESTRNIEAFGNSLKLYPLDILEPDHCRKLITQLKPDYIFHLAALASVGQSFEKERAFFRVNFEGTVNVLEAARQIPRLKAFLFVSSADVYGAFSPKGKTLTEEQPFNPISPYGISKAAAERTALYYHRSYGLPVIVARSFNHSGPKQDDGFVIPAFSKQIASIEAGFQPPVVKTGDLSARRDLSDVRDIVRGYRLAVTVGQPGQVYQFCSGRSVSIQKVLDLLLTMSSGRIKQKIDRAKLRKSDIPVLRGSNRKATQKLGFKTRYKLRDTLLDTLAYWRKEVRGNITKKATKAGESE